MKRQTSSFFFVPASFLFLLALFWVAPAWILADVEIDLDDLSKPTPVPTVKSVPTPKTILPQPTIVTAPVRQPTVFLQPAPSPVVGGKVEAPAEPAPTAVVVSGILKMKDIYNAGIKAYKDMDYDQAIRYLTEAVKKNDPYTPKFYYAEAYATLGVIYQFHIIHFDKAYEYYRLALKYEKNNRTAKKHIKEVAQQTQE